MPLDVHEGGQLVQGIDHIVLGQPRAFLELLLRQLWVELESVLRAFNEYPSDRVGRCRVPRVRVCPLGDSLRRRAQRWLARDAVNIADQLFPVRGIAQLWRRRTAKQRSEEHTSELQSSMRNS